MNNNANCEMPFGSFYFETI